MEYFSGLGYLWMVFFIMISAGLAKEYNLFVPVYAYIKDTFGSNKFVVVILSAIGGILPIEGRVTVSAGLLDTVAPKCGHGREKMGIVDYLSTHHYYMWSPLEKTVLLPIAAFGLTYSAFIYFRHQFFRKQGAKEQSSLCVELLLTTKGTCPPGALR
jgi:hypothetical protein